MLVCSPLMSRVKFPKKQTLRPRGLHVWGVLGKALGCNSSGEMKTGLSGGRSWAVNKGLSRSPKELWAWEGPSELSQNEKSGWAFPPPPGWVIGWGLPLGRECNFGQSNSFQAEPFLGGTGLWVAAEGVSTSALKANLGSSPCPKAAGAKEAFTFEDAENEEWVYIFISIVQVRKQSSFWYVLAVRQQESLELVAQAEALLIRLTWVNSLCRTCKGWFWRKNLNYRRGKYFD